MIRLRRAVPLAMTPIVAAAAVALPLPARLVAAMRRLRRRTMGPVHRGKAVIGHHGELAARQGLDVADKCAFRAVAERDRHAVGAGARGAADAVDIALGH